MKVNKAAFEQLEKKYKFNHSQMAKYIGVDRTQYWRVLNGKCRPGADFIEKFKTAFPKQKLEKYFFVQSVA